MKYRSRSSRAGTAVHDDEHDDDSDDDEDDWRIGGDDDRDVGVGVKIYMR